MPPTPDQTDPTTDPDDISITEEELAAAAGDLDKIRSSRCGARVTTPRFVNLLSLLRLAFRWSRSARLK